jgi:hypothetical protein
MTATATAPATATTTTQKTSRRRGYLLFEAVIGGVVMVTIFAACLTLIAQARAKTSIAARRQAAASIASATLDDLVARAMLLPQSQALADVDPILHPGLRVGFDVVDVSAAFAANGPVGGTLLEITVRAEHPDERGAPALYELRSLRRLR